MGTLTQLSLLRFDAALQPYGPFIERKEALRQGLRHYYNGKPCKKGHISVRFIDCCKCVDCGRKQSLQGMLRWYAKNPEEARKRARQMYVKHGSRWQQERRQRGTTPQERERERIRSRRRREQLEARITGALRNRLGDAIKGRNRSAKTMQLLGCTVEFLMDHIASQFQPGMSWENWGQKTWHIDHIRPCASFDLTDPEQQRQCFHYSNLQPLWAADNIRKGAKVA